MADVFTHQDTGAKFIDFGTDYGGSRLMHIKSGALRIIPEDTRNWNFVCWEKDEMVNPTIKIPAKKPARGLDELVGTIIAEVKELGV